jgi:hypothetical protein
MSYEILGNTGKYWTCHQEAWVHYLRLATAGWEPQGAFLKRDEGGLSEHPSGSYLGNDFQMVFNEDARTMSAALNLAVATIDAGGPMSEVQATALAAFAVCEEESVLVGLRLTKEQEAEERAAKQRWVRTLNVDVDIRGIIGLADAANAGGFTIA